MSNDKLREAAQKVCRAAKETAPGWWCLPLKCGTPELRFAVNDLIAALADSTDALPPSDAAPVAWTWTTVDRVTGRERRHTSFDRPYPDAYTKDVHALVYYDHPEDAPGDDKLRKAALEVYHRWATGYDKGYHEMREPMKRLKAALATVPKEKNDQT